MASADHNPPSSLAYADEEPEIATDYWPLVHRALRVSIFVFVVKVFASIALTWHWGGAIEVRFLYGVIPYFAIRATRPVFVDVITWSGVAMTVAALLPLLVTLVLIRGRARRHALIGGFVGVPIAALTLLLEWVRHLLDPPVLTTSLTAQAASALAAGAVLFVGFLPKSARRPRQIRDEVERMLDITLPTPTHTTPHHTPMETTGEVHQ